MKHSLVMFSDFFVSVRSEVYSLERCSSNLYRCCFSCWIVQEAVKDSTKLYSLL